MKLWRLKESKVKEMFSEEVNKSCDGNGNWDGLKRKLLDISRDVCCYTWGKVRHSETWWNRDVDVVYVEIGIYFEFGSTIEREFVSMAINRAARGTVESLIPLLIFVSYLKLQNKEQSKSKILLE